MAAATGAGGMLENPGNSYLWLINGIVLLITAGSWFDIDYSACCFAGARRKLQKLRSNIEELRDLSSECHHKHSEGDWTPKWDPSTGEYLFAGSEEAEYTA